MVTITRQFTPSYSRSASEEFISGEVWFDDLRLQAVEP
jgi:hypothetical protein